MPFDPRKHDDIKYELFDLIQTAYHAIGGHAKVKTPDDVLADPDWNVWVGMDIHNDPDFDLISYGSKTPFGIKFSGVGHDGSPAAKKIYVDLRAKDLKMPGYYVEASGKLADILIKKGVPVISDQATVEKVLNKKVQWTGSNTEDQSSAGDGWYIRKIGPDEHSKIMLGMPNVSLSKSEKEKEDAPEPSQTTQVMKEAFKNWRGFLSK